MLVLRLMNQQLEFFIPLRLGGVLLDLCLQLALVPDKQPAARGAVVRSKAAFTAVAAAVDAAAAAYTKTQIWQEHYLTRHT